MCHSLQVTGAEGVKFEDDGALSDSGAISDGSLGSPVVSSEDEGEEEGDATSDVEEERAAEDALAGDGRILGQPRGVEGGEDGMRGELQVSPPNNPLPSASKLPSVCKAQDRLGPLLI